MRIFVANFYSLLSFFACGMWILFFYIESLLPSCLLASVDHTSSIEIFALLGITARPHSAYEYHIMTLCAVRFGSESLTVSESSRSDE